MNTTAKKLLAPALLLSLMAVAFRFDEHSIIWFWAAQPPVAAFLIGGALVCWALLLHALARHRGHID